MGNEIEGPRNSPLRKISNRLLIPVVDFFKKIPGIKADHITLSGLGLVGLGSLEKIIDKGPMAAYVAFALISLGVSFDGLDGALARTLNQSSPKGAILDLLVDRGEESLMALSRIATASFRGDPLGVLAATLVGLTNPIPSYIRAKVEARGGTVPESGRNPISFLGTRVGRVITGVPATAFPTMIEFGNLSFQAGVDLAGALTNIINSIERLSVFRKCIQKQKIQEQKEEPDLSFIGKEKEEKLGQFILLNTATMISAGIIGLINSFQSVQ